MGDGTNLHYREVQLIHTAGGFEVWLPPRFDSGVTEPTRHETLHGMLY